jgi:tetratricopeptide (TPR) repeat protein
LRICLRASRRNLSAERRRPTCVCRREHGAQHQPETADGHRIRGVIYRARGDQGRAVAHFSAWIEAEPKNASAYQWRGKSYTDKGDFDRAIADFTREIEIEPDDADAYRYRSTAYARKQNHEAALADYNRAIELTRRKIQSGDRLLP